MPSDPAFDPNTQHVGEYNPGRRELLAFGFARALAANSIPGKHHHPQNLIPYALELADAFIAAIDGKTEDHTSPPNQTDTPY